MLRFLVKLTKTFSSQNSSNNNNNHLKKIGQGGPLFIYKMSPRGPHGLSHQSLARRFSAFKRIPLTDGNQRRSETGNQFVEINNCIKFKTCFLVFLFFV